MKANMKGLGGIKGMLLLHGEKVGIAVVALLALWFIYASLKLPRLDAQYQAPKLQDRIREASAAVDSTQWPDPKRDPEAAEKVREVNLVARSDNVVVDPGAYDVTLVPPPVISPSVLRTDPPLLNAMEVRAIGGSGLFAFTDDEVRKAQELRQAAQQAELEKQREREVEREQREAGRTQRDRDRRRGQPVMDYTLDPAHPTRRPIEGVTQPAGIALQGGERIERAHWAAVVAKVPIRQQMNLYEDAFENARGGFDPSRDFPQYVGYIVERAEVVRGKPLEWKRVSLFDGQRKSIPNRPIAAGVSETALQRLQDIAAKEWAGPAAEPIAEDYFDPILTLPLPPLVGRDWGADATHPDIPLAIHAPPLEEELEPDEDELLEQPAEGEEMEFIRRDPAQGFGRPGFSAQPGFGPRQQPLMRGPAMGRMHGEGEFGPSRFRGGGQFGGRGGQGAMPPRGVDYKLLRFFDFTVQPGKKYKYRVKVVLADPNYGLTDSALDPAVQDRLRATKQKGVRIVGEWSEPSPTVGIPLAGAVYLAEATMPTGRLFNDEPSVTLWAQKFDRDRDGTAVHVAKEKVFRRGYVVNLQEKMDYTGDGDRWMDTYDSYKLHTGVAVLDVKGADRVTRDMTSPARVLVMDESGELSVRHELDDSTNVEYLRALFAPPDRRRGRGDERGGFPGGEFGPFGPGGRRGP